MNSGITYKVIKKVTQKPVTITAAAECLPSRKEGMRNVWEGELSRGLYLGRNVLHSGRVF